MLGLRLRLCLSLLLLSRLTPTRTHGDSDHRAALGASSGIARDGALPHAFQQVIADP